MSLELFDPVKYAAVLPVLRTVDTVHSIPLERPPAPMEEQLERLRSLAIRLQQECTTALNELRADEAGVLTH